MFLMFPAVLGASVRFWTTSRTREIDQVRLREREQLARELHDTVAHHVSAMVIRAQAGRVVAASRPRRGASMHSRSSRTKAPVPSPRCGPWWARCAIARMPTSPRRTASPTSSGSRAASTTNLGSQVRLTGDLDDAQPGGRGSDRTASPRSRSPTPCGMHATPPGSTCRSPERIDAVRLTVRDDGEPVHASSVAPGYGVVGMTERATLLGGTLEAGPRPDRGWVVDAVLPRAGPSR